MDRPGLSLNVVAMGVALVASGCTAQLNSNTVDMQAAYKELLFKQTLYNLGQAITEDTHFFPSQALIGTGSAQTTNTITPSVTIPFPAATVASAFGATGTTPTLTNTSTNVLGNAGLGVAFADAWQFTWGLTPRTDPDELRRLRALYLYAVGGPLGSCYNDTEFTDEDRVKYKDVDAKYRACFQDQYVMQGGNQTANAAFTQEPGCVICGSAGSRYVNGKLLHGFVTTTARPDFKPFKRYGLTVFYVREIGGENGFTDFVLFLLEAMSVTAAIPYKGPTALDGATTFPMPPKTQFLQPNIFSLPL